MNYEITGKPDFSLVEMQLEQGESVRAESGAMAWMDPSVEIHTQARGGILKSLGRSVLGGESFFVNTFTAEKAPGRIAFAPATVGDVAALPLNGELFLTSGAYIANTGSVEIDSKWGGLKGLFSGTGLFMLRAHGQGELFFGAFGAMHKVEVEGQYFVDNGHLVAFEPTLDYSIRKLGGWKSFLFGGECLVCEFRGRGAVYIQTRNATAFAAWADQFRRVEKSRS